ncbi:ATP-binding protein [Reichenbachiella agarivorans]|uniref:histidine kinase n=1 Tax=Reichenbachiella agarivorans TaxID=2979464 RepID=A0ABY6CPR4_9BACT|nr:ATP-binding protein [Reichenbachiella agarivorans]UXP32487.1 ATP-binding protein [Reichenbachiella agarivorans]
MQIRNRLTYLFILVVAIILSLSSISIYFFSADYRRDDFYTRLLNKGTNIAKLLIEVEEVDANLLRKIEFDNPVNLPEEKIIIFNYQNEKLYSSDDEDLLGITPEMLDEIRLNEEIRFSKGQYEVLGFLFSDQYDRFVVFAAAVDIYGLKKLKNLQIVLLVVFGMSIVLVFISGWVFSGRVLKPISRVIEQVNDITITSLNLRVEEGNGKDEIAQLANTFNKMLDRLETAFKVQKNFIANASHELRTPLTAITGQLEVTLLKSRSNEEYLQSIQSALEDMKNLNNISNRLLLLAQTSSESQEVELKPLRIDDIVWQVRSELIKRNTTYQVDVSLDADLDDESQLTILGNEQLLKTAIINLMDNGCKYSPTHRVAISIEKDGDLLLLRFNDQGIGIDSNELKHVFEPFYRSKRAITYKGHGIGLSLVDRIIQLHKGRIEVESVLGQGTTFTIFFDSGE